MVSACRSPRIFSLLPNNRAVVIDSISEFDLERRMVDLETLLPPTEKNSCVYEVSSIFQFCTWKLVSLALEMIEEVDS